MNNFQGYNIESYGTGNMIKIPGKSEREPNAYPFGTTYDFIYDDLKTKDQELYTKNGMLHIMERNRRIKVRNNKHHADQRSDIPEIRYVLRQKGPEKFQECTKEYEIILTVEEKVYDQVRNNDDTIDKVHNVENVDTVHSVDDTFWHH